MEVRACRLPHSTVSLFPRAGSRRMPRREAAELYLDAVAPACRACHANQERSLDFDSYDGFMVFEDAHEELVLKIECGLDDDSGGNDDQAVMPLALETYDLFWMTGQVDVFKDHVGPVECGD